MEPFQPKCHFQLEDWKMNFARNNGIDIVDGKITMTVKQISYTLRMSKAEKGIPVNLACGNIRK